MADGPFRGDVVLEAFEKERAEQIRELRRQRRVAIMDAYVGAAGIPLSLVHAFAPWSILLDMVHATWIPYAFAAAYVAFGIWNVVEAARLHRRLARLT